MDTMSELYKINELPEGMFPLSFKLICHYQWEDPFLLKKLKYAKYKRVIFAEAGIL